MKQSGLILSNITQIQGNNETVLFQPSSIIGSLPLGYKYSFHCRYDLRLESRLTQSLSLSVVPPINPEDSTYRRYAKWQAATSNSEKIFLQLKSQKRQKIIKTIECLNFGGVWQENLTESSFLDFDDVLVAQIKPGRTVLGGDYIFLHGNYIIEIDSIPESNLFSAPKNLGILIDHEVKLIVPANAYRARLHLMNSGDVPCHLAFGLQQNCIPGECLYLPPGTGWNDERIDKAVVSSAVWATTGGAAEDNLSSMLTGLEVSWVG